ncbi:MAG: response regulator [Methanotrichaceae archaeon]
MQNENLRHANLETENAFESDKLVLEGQPFKLRQLVEEAPDLISLEAAEKGLNLEGEIRKHNRPKIIAITSYAIQGDREKCLEAGMDGYIAKPVRMDELTEVLKRVSAV